MIYQGSQTKIYSIADHRGQDWLSKIIERNVILLEIICLKLYHPRENEMNFFLQRFIFNVYILQKTLLFTIILQDFIYEITEKAINFVNVVACFFCEKKDQGLLLMSLFSKSKIYCVY